MLRRYLREHEDLSVARDKIAYADGESLWRNYGRYLNVEFPSPKTGGSWKLTPKGYVGQIRQDDKLEFWLQPKVGVANLFGMLEYAYSLDPRFRDELIGCSSVDELFERLASILADRVLLRAKRGFYRSYVGRRERLSYIRGRIELKRQLRQAWIPEVHCKFEEQTSDIEENGILLWTLKTILRSGFCSSRVAPKVRRAFRTLRGVVSEQAYSARDCSGRDYNRLNIDYQPMHCLCRFFLENTGPGHDRSDSSMLPFLVNMNSLFEKFVAEWLRRNTAMPHTFKAHQKTAHGDDCPLSFDPDLVLLDQDSGVKVAVLDTKYKSPDKPANSDVFQVTSYAEAHGCSEAFLIYPEELSNPLDVEVGRIRVRSIAFAIGTDIESGGRAFLAQLGTALSFPRKQSLPRIEHSRPFTRTLVACEARRG